MQNQNYPFTKILYFGFIFTTFILLTISLTASCWIDGKPLLQSESNQLPNSNVYAMYFVVLLIGDLFIFNAAIFFLLSYRISHIFHNISTITVSVQCIAITSLLCVIVSTSIPMHTKESFNNFGYGYVLLLCAIYFSLCSLITSLKIICYQNLPKSDNGHYKDNISYIRYY